MIESEAGRDEDRALRLARMLEATHPQTRARSEVTALLSVLEELAPLLPDGGLPAGVVTQVSDMALLPALTAGVSAALPYAHTGVVGMPALGLSAWAGFGQDIRRTLLADSPGRQWAEVVSALIPACDVVIAAPPPDGTLTPHLAQRLAARLRRHRCALVSPTPWPGAALVLEVTGPSGRLGLGAGRGCPAAVNRGGLPGHIPVRAGSWSRQRGSDAAPHPDTPGDNTRTSRAVWIQIPAGRTEAVRKAQPALPPRSARPGPGKAPGRPSTPPTESKGGPLVCALTDTHSTCQIDGALPRHQPNVR
ncbi:hypothetical protein GCM10010440_71010 [Kitasatospora cinereorecta]